MSQNSIPSRMSLPELQGDPCASTLRQHVEGILEAASRSDRLVRNYPDVADDLAELRSSVERYAGAVLGKLVETGIPAEGESVSPAKNAPADYRIDRSSGCWIWMRRVYRDGYPVIGRKTRWRDNVPSRIYWMLVHGPLDPDEVVVRTCGMRLCINPEHGEIRDRHEHAAAQMRDRSPLSWDDVREIRSVLCSSRDDFRERVTGFSVRFKIGRHSIMDVFRNKVWFDPEYSPGFEVKCAGPGCNEVFRTTNIIRKYHCEECRESATTMRSRAARSHELHLVKSPERRAREEAALRAEAEAAATEWADAVPDEPRSSVWSVASLDQPIGEDSGVLRDVVAAPSADGDPAVELERRTEAELLEGLTEESIEAMDDVAREKLQSRLIAAGVASSTSHAA